MIGWIWRMIVGRFKAEPAIPPCAHKWAEKPVKITDVLDDQGRNVNVIFTMRCEKCGILDNHWVQ